MAFTGRSAARIVVGAAMIAGATVVVAAAMILVGTTTSSACGPCHSSRAFVENTGKSAHAKVTCARCHAGGGFAERVTYSSSVLLSMTLRIGTGGGRGAAAVSNRTCISCHADVMAGPTTSKGISIAHASCTIGSLCTDCHSTTAHGDSVGWARSYTMAGCLNCHAAAQATRDCAACHPEAQPSQETSASAAQTTAVHSPLWKTSHGMGDQRTCEACHSPQYCAACHGVDLPHPDDFSSNHSSAAKSAASSCARCHTDSFCEDCHRTPMPHDRTFAAKHPEITRKSGEAECLRCHLKDDCRNCHNSHIHPGGALAPAAEVDE